VGAEVSNPVIEPDELGTYLADPGINTARAEQLIEQAQTLCESIIDPLPPAGAAIVMRVAGRAYTSILSPRQQQMAAAGGMVPVGTFGGGVYLSQYDIADLRRLAGGGGAFSIDLLPAGYTAPLPPYTGMSDWDQIS
jgi:hypothetical protein